MQPPEFWNKGPSQKNMWPVLLAPLSKLWQWAGQNRWQNGAHTKIPIPVICIGNVNLGGTGKTPTVIEAITQLIAMGKKPHVVTKGYKGQLKGPILVNPQIHTATDVGDEPLLLAAFAPTWVSKNRHDGAQSAYDAGADVIILDDGLQNPAIAKDLTVLVVDAKIGFGNGCVFPAGPLREPIENAVKKSDLLLTIGQPQNLHQDFIAAWPTVQKLPHATSTIIPLETGMNWKNTPVFAFAGIGRPEKFYETLKGLGANILKTRDFDDHQTIPTTLLTRMEHEANALGAQLVTTEKDAVRLPKNWQQKVLTIPVRLKIHDTEVFRKSLKAIFNS